MIRDSDFEMSMTSPGELPEDIYNSDADKQRAQGSKGKPQSPQSARAATPHALEAILMDLRNDVHKIAEKVGHLEEEQAKRLADLKRMYERVAQLEKGHGTNLLASEGIQEDANLPAVQQVLDAPAEATPPSFTSPVVPAPVEPQVNLSEQ